MNKNIKSENSKYLLTLSSVLLASFFINIFIKKGFVFDYLYLDISAVNTFYSDDFISVLMFVSMKRIKQFLVLLVLVNVVKKRFVYNGFVILFGILFGILITIQTYYEGISGVFVLILYIFPHYIVYLILLKEMCSDYYEKMNSKKIIIFIMLLLIGILCEAFFSRFFLIKYYQYMVP